MSWLKDLANYRILKNFNSKSYIDAKCTLLNEYLKVIDHSCVVIGVSGGIDSATVLGLVVNASTYDDSPIKKIVAVTIPEFVDGTVGQFDSFYKALKLVDKLQKVYGTHIDFNCAELTDGHKSIKKYSGIDMDSWASGQLVSYARTTMLYGIVSAYYSKGYPAILCGTTNFDEGSYIGYFGKASDGCVDIQLISDLHKSEVNKIAVDLQITDEIINAVPSGDLYNGQTDEQYIGSPYDFMELYFGYLMGKASITEKENPLIDNWIKKIEKMREQSIHKYIGEGYAVRLKLSDDTIKKTIDCKKSVVDKTRFVNFVDLKLSKFLSADANMLSKKMVNKIVSENDNVTIGNNLLSMDECEHIVNTINSYKWFPVATDGYLANYKFGDAIGSYRLTVYDEDFSLILWNRLKDEYASYINFKNMNSVDVGNCSIWRPIGISPLIRFIKYETTDNYLYPHYDHPYFYEDGKRTIQSLVIYLDNTNDGQTIFIKDLSESVPINKRDMSDWKRIPNEKEIIYSVEPEKGKFLIFNHGILHASKNISGDKPKIIIRTDIIFEKCMPSEFINITRPINFEEVTNKHTDKFMKSASLIYSQSELEEAGLTNIKRCSRLYNDKQNLLATPLHKIFSSLENILNTCTKYDLMNKEIFILVNTGCYDPIHIGHVHIMEEAYNYLTSKGCTVLGGYLIPAHTKYVTKKNKVDSYLKRLDDCQKFVNKHEWLSVDPYEILFEDDDICYTEILTRLENYFKTHVENKYKININIGYVFGGDRAKFMRSFVNVGYGICVGRYGYDEIFNNAKLELQNCTNNKNMFWIDRQLEFPDISSTLIRNEKIVKLNAETKDTIYYVRNENLNVENYQYYCNKLFNIIKESFANIKSISFKMVDSNVQNNKLVKNTKYKTISIDPFIKSDYYINISRLFGYGEPKSFKKIIDRPNFKPLSEQIKLIPSGSYELVDDDSVTGTTMTFAENILIMNNSIEIKEKTLLTNYYEYDNLFDVVDCRDFLVGSYLGGLVVQIPNGEYVKVPYMLPYVYPSDRAKIPVEQNMLFSKKIWELNLDYYTKNKKFVKEIDVSTRTFLNYIGFADECPMQYVCAWHLIFFN